MNLTIINGSPRNKKSNSKILIEKFLEGYCKIDSSNVAMHYLANIQKMDEHAASFANTETVLIIFPLYTDCMPGIVKEFFEAIAVNKYGNKKRVGFIVQSGFPESAQSVYLEKYLKKLTSRMECEYIGTVIKGGVEGIQIMPSYMTNKLFTNFTNLGEHFAKTGCFNEEIVGKLRTPYKMSKANLFGFKLMSKTGLTNFYWNSNLKKHNAFENRFATPYVK
jgi:NAD(P)H-dependent FMN reductase